MRVGPYQMNLVFVHFAKRIPRYLLNNLEHTVQKFPEHKVWLVTSKDTTFNGISGLYKFEYNPIGEWHYIADKLSHPAEFRDGFWLKSLGRFVALKEFIKFNSSELLHIESDVILSKDFPFSELTQNNADIAFPIVSPTQGIASILYLRNQQIAENLVKHAIDSVTLENSSTDMTILFSFWKNGKEKTSILPIGPMKNIDHVKCKENYSGYFDGLDYGYYLFGEDPRNNRGFTKSHQKLENYFFNVANQVIVYSNERHFLNVYDFDEMVFKPVYSLHIHSKNPKLFKAHLLERKLKLQIDKLELPPSKVLFINVAILQILQAIQRRTRNIVGN